jgi:hypothetical protein
MIGEKTLTVTEIEKVGQLADQAKCLPGMLLALPHVSSDLLVGMLLACQNFAEDIDRAMSDILKVRP